MGAAGAKVTAGAGAPAVAAAGAAEEAAAAAARAAAAAIAAGGAPSGGTGGTRVAAGEAARAGVSGAAGAGALALPSGTTPGAMPPAAGFAARKAAARAAGPGLVAPALEGGLTAAALAVLSWQEHLVRGHPYIRSQSATRRSERGRQATIPPSQSAHQASYPSLEPVSCTGVTRDRSTSSCPSGLCASRPARYTLSFGARRSLYPAAPRSEPTYLRGGEEAAG